MTHSAKNILWHIHCNANKNFFIDAMGILHKKVIDFNSRFSSVVIPQILIKYLLHASHDSLGHVGTAKLYHFLKIATTTKARGRKYINMLDHVKNVKS